MIINKNFHPEQSLYYWGAVVLDVIKTFADKSIDYLTIYEEVKKEYNISFELFSLTLDWLFILGTIENKKGRIKKCF
ncbi:MAG: hypothetical protein HRU35_06830 [Rickettsiaceae bacterium]|nr:hypothetical protein [Rickettsiaceae bacterium]